MSIRVHILAKKLGVSSKELMDQCERLGIKVTSHMNALEDETAALVEAEWTKSQEGSPVVAEAPAVSPVPHKKPAAAHAPKAPKQPSTPAPIVEAPVVEVPVLKAPVIEAPVIEAPVIEAPVVEAPVIQAPPKAETEPVVETEKPAKAQEEFRILHLAPEMTVREVSERLGLRVNDLITELMKQGIMCSLNQVPNADVVIAIAEKKGILVDFKTRYEEVLTHEEEEKTTDERRLEMRPPVVTVMGHVDHGKTMLLDAIRKTNKVATEAGGITQHIGAHVTQYKGNRVVFLDTPGHEAFTAMRARGSKVTDLVVLVIAADDGVMPQTLEAINHAKVADVPMVVAINKTDLPQANVPRVKQQLVDLGFMPEEWGGKTICVEVSAKEGKGIDTLMEMILLESEMLELKADPTKRARGVVIEARLDRGKGCLATVLVTEGTLKVGDVFVADVQCGKVRAMLDELGRKVKDAGPSMAVELTGWSNLPQAGDTFQVLENERMAREIVARRADDLRTKNLRQSGPLVQTWDDIFAQIKDDAKAELRLVIKADVQGTLGALTEALSRIKDDRVRLKIVHQGIGAVSQGDVMLASATQAIITAFSVRPESGIESFADKEGVEIRQYSVIYDVIKDVRDGLEGLLQPKRTETVVGKLDVREVFKISGVGPIAGCFVTEGRARQHDGARLVRDGRVVYEGTLASLRRFKDNVAEVDNGLECGAGLQNFSDIKVGDIIELFSVDISRQKLKS